MWLAALCAAIATELAWPSGPRRVQMRLRRSAPDAVSTAARPKPKLERWHLVAIAVLAAMAAVALFSGPVLVLALTAVGVVTIALDLLHRGRARSRAAQRRRETTESLSFLVAELRAGSTIEQALTSVAAENQQLEPAARAARSGVDVKPILADVSATEGFEALELLGSAWQVADQSGAPMAAVLQRLVDRLRDELDLNHEIESEMAPARATARIMSILPLAGLGLGAGLGGNPFQVVVTKPIAAWSVAFGLGLAMVGLVWIERLADTVPRVGAVR